MTYVREQEHLETPDAPWGGFQLLQNKKRGAVYHRIWHAPESGAYLHVLGGAKDPTSGAAASLLLLPVGRGGYGLAADRTGRYPEGVLAVARQITHYRVRGGGLGTCLMEEATKYHGQLLSDRTNSAGVERIFDKLAATPGFRVALAPRVSQVSEAEYQDPSHPATARHVIESVPAPRRRKG